MSKDQNDGWISVGCPAPWKPTKPGDAIEGRYVGRRTRRGAWGDFEVFTVRESNGSVWDVSGARLFRLFSYAALREGEEVRVLFRGESKVKGRKTPMRDFEIFIRDTAPQCHPSAT